MCDDDIHQGLTEDPTVSRRAFALSAVAVAGLAGAARAADAVVEADVEVKTPDGTADAALYHPAGKGPWPAVLIWTDVLSLRPAFREMGRRLAASGYVVLVPNVYYRVKHAPVVEGAFDFSKPEDRARLGPMRASLTSDGVERDAVAYTAFLDAQPQTDRKKGMGVQGYCMGGPLTFKTAALASDRIRAAATFHGAGLVAKDHADPASPHNWIPKMKCELIVCIAQNDAAAQPDAKDVLKAAFAASKVPAKVEVYPANHGWCVKGSAVYDEAAAEQAWAELLALYKRALG